MAWRAVAARRSRVEWPRPHLHFLSISCAPAAGYSSTIYLRRVSTSRSAFPARVICRSSTRSTKYVTGCGSSSAGRRGEPRIWPKPTASSPEGPASSSSRADPALPTQRSAFTPRSRTLRRSLRSSARSAATLRTARRSRKSIIGACTAASRSGRRRSSGQNAFLNTSPARFALRFPDGRDRWCSRYPKTCSRHG